MSRLSQRTDGYGFHYGFRDDDDHRQINVRLEDRGWKAYVDSYQLDGCYPALIAAEAAAYRWMDANPIRRNTA